MRNLDNYFEQYLAHEFEKVQMSFRHREVLRFLEKRNAKHVLEVGCGLHPLFTEYAQFDTFTVLEPTDGFYKKACELASDNPSIRIIHATLEEASLSMQGQTFDAIIISSLLHEVSDPSALLQAAMRLMEMGSAMHINTPNARSFHRLLGLEMGAIESLSGLSDSQVKLQQQSFFTKETLRALIEEQGLAVFDEGSYFIKPFTHAQMAKLLDIGLLTQDMLEGLSRMIKHIPEIGSEIYINASKTL